MELPCRGSNSVTCTSNMPVIFVRLWHRRPLKQYAGIWLKPCSVRRREGYSSWHTRALRWRSTWRACTWQRSMNRICSKKKPTRCLRKIETILHLGDRVPSMQLSYSKETTLRMFSALVTRSARTFRATMEKKSLFFPRLLKKTLRRACSMPREKHQVMKTRSLKTEECQWLVLARSNLIDISQYLYASHILIIYQYQIH